MVKLGMHIRPNRPNNKYSRTSQKQNFRGSAYAPPQHMRPSNQNQSHQSKQYAANTTDAAEVLSPSQIQSMIDDRMQQLFLASSSPSPMAASPSDPGSAMTMSGASGGQCIRGPCRNVSIFSTLRGMRKGHASYTVHLAKFDIVPQYIKNQLAA